MRVKIIENPVGVLSTRWRKPSQIVQPNQFGDDASKTTCLWVVDENGNAIEGVKLTIDPSKKHYGRTIIRNGKLVWIYANQTESGQNRLSDTGNRWKDRSETYDGIAKAFAGIVL